MQEHKYHRHFLLILQKLYKEKGNDNFVDITDCLTGTDDQNTVIVHNLNLSEFAIIKKDVVVDLLARNQKPPRFSGKILPLGIDYFEDCVNAYVKSKKKRPPMGFKTNG